MRTGQRRWVRRLLLTLWSIAVVAATAATVVPWTPGDRSPWELPGWLPSAGAVAMTALLTHALAVRSGGRPLLAGGLAVVLAGVAAATGSPVLLAGAAVGTAVVTAILAVLVTKPAARFPGVGWEVVLATVVTAAGAFGVAAYQAEVALERTEYLVIGLSLAGALALVYRLGAGLHGLGRRGWLMILTGVLLLTVALAYAEALARWGPPGAFSGIQEALDAVREVSGALPRPIFVLLGVPALTWGVAARARRPQGWWVCAFAAPGLSVVAVSLLDSGRTLVEAGLAAAYGLVLGLLVGYLILRVDLYLTGARGRRARRLEELAAHRPEPGRLSPLL